MSGRDTHAEQDAIITAACAWAGAMEVLDEYRRDGMADDELAVMRAGIDERNGAPLLAAVNAYLAGRDGS